MGPCTYNGGVALIVPCNDGGTSHLRCLQGAASIRLLVSARGDTHRSGQPIGCEMLQRGDVSTQTRCVEILRGRQYHLRMFFLADSQVVCGAALIAADSWSPIPATYLLVQFAYLFRSFLQGGDKNPPDGFCGGVKHPPADETFCVQRGVALFVGAGGTRATAQAPRPPCITKSS